MSGQLKEVRERIVSIKSTQQITNAMKMVSAAKMAKAQRAITEMRPYADRLDHMLTNILSNLGSDAGTSFGIERDIKSVLVVVVTSNRGLCGGFNSNIVKAAVAQIEKKYKAVRAAGKLSILCIGKLGLKTIKRDFSDCNIIEDHVALFGELNYENVATISDQLMSEFKDGTYDVIDVAYSRFKNAGVQFTELHQYLPVVSEERGRDSEKKESNADYIFEPDKNSLLEQLVPSILQTTLFKFMLDTHAAEHGARMTAMDKATENAEEMVKELKIDYNKARQEAITKELSEIVGGAAALKG